MLISVWQRDCEQEQAPRQESILIHQMRTSWSILNSFAINAQTIFTKWRCFGSAENRYPNYTNSIVKDNFFVFLVGPFFLPIFFIDFFLPFYTEIGCNTQEIPRLRPC